MKLFTLDNRLILRVVGTLGEIRSKSSDTSRSTSLHVLTGCSPSRSTSAASSRRGRLSNGPFDMNTATSPGRDVVRASAPESAAFDSQAAAPGPRALIARASASV